MWKRQDFDNCEMNLNQNFLLGLKGRQIDIAWQFHEEAKDDDG